MFDREDGLVVIFKYTHGGIFEKEQKCLSF